MSMQLLVAASSIQMNQAYSCRRFKSSKSRSKRINIGKPIRIFEIKY